MESSLWNLTLEDFGERVASSDTTVAAVGVSAVTAVYSLGLIVMVLDVTARRKDFAGDRQRLQFLMESANNESARLTKYADADPKAYGEYREACRLPRNTDQEKRERDQSVAAALRKATAVPLAAARAAAAGLDICFEAAGMVSGAVSADLCGAALLLTGAARAILRTVATNLQVVDDLQYRQEVAAESQSLEERVNLQSEVVVARLTKPG